MSAPSSRVMLAIDLSPGRLNLRAEAMRREAHLLARRCDDEP